VTEPDLCVISQYKVKFAEALQRLVILLLSLIDQCQVVQRLDARRVRLHGFAIAIARFLRVSPHHQHVSLVDQGAGVVAVGLHG